jgi:hypothetical protein
MSIENPTLVHFRHFSSLLTNLPSTTVEGALQIRPFLTNKPNFPDDQMNVSTVITKDYEQLTMNNEPKNKANSNPIKPNSKPIIDSKMPKQTQCLPHSLSLRHRIGHVFAMLTFKLYLYKLSPLFPMEWVSFKKSKLYY